MPFIKYYIENGKSEETWQEVEAAAREREKGRGMRAKAQYGTVSNYNDIV